MKPKKEKLIKTLLNKKDLWNRYRKSQNYSKIDLRYSDLRGSNLNGSDLRGSNLSGSNLSGSNLRGSDLNGSDLRGSNLSGSNLSGSDLSYSDLRDSDLRDSNLRGSNLSGSDLSGSDLSYSDLRYSDLNGSDLRGSNLSGSDLSGSDLSYSNLRDSDLRDSNLRGSNLSGSDLRHADLSGSKANEFTSFYFLSCPETGSYTAYKKADNKIIKLFIPASAKRSSATSHKCRASKAKVLEFQDLDGNKLNIDKVKSNYDKNFIYEIGKHIIVKDFDTDRWNECSTGIHHFIIRELAVNY